MNRLGIYGFIISIMALTGSLITDIPDVVIGIWFVIATQLICADAIIKAIQERQQ